MNTAKVKKISKDEFAEIISEYSDDDNDLSVMIDESDSFPLYNDKSIICVETNSILENSSAMDYDKSFKCVLIESPEGLDLNDTQRILNLFPTKDCHFGIRTANNLRIRYLLNGTE